MIVNYSFFIPREMSGKKVSDWTDIDILTYNGEELHIVQCKPFLDRSKPKKKQKRYSSGSI
ncbi:MAG: hypothetical protein DRN04_13140 [Thermoprotei archaeon]|nr:MAG: hypothetical protein DRN04_13140 [Thermoprotei archaeon]